MQGSLPIGAVDAGGGDRSWKGNQGPPRMSRSCKPQAMGFSSLLCDESRALTRPGRLTDGMA